LKVELSGGRGGDRADQAILRHLKREEVHELRQRTFVVTNDRSLQALVVNLRAHYMPVGAFDATLRKFNCLA
jgi:rRNA-processing protein FCF1